MLPRPRHLIALGLTATLVGVSACGGGEPEPGTAEEVDAANAVALGEKPEVEVDGAEGADELRSDDLAVGEGEEATAGAVVTVHYVGVAASSGEEFDASWDRGEPFQFQLGGGQVIEGWERGVEGMRVGGRRELTIPPDMAYGDRGVPGAIAPNETLVFVVDLLEVG